MVFVSDIKRSKKKGLPEEENSKADDIAATVGSKKEKTGKSKGKKKGSTQCKLCFKIKQYDVR